MMPIDLQPLDRNCLKKYRFNPMDFAWIEIRYNRHVTKTKIYIMKGYLFLYVIVAIWLFLDAKKRLTNGIPWAAFTVLLGPVVVPFWLAKRPLRDGEVREGGTAWNVLKFFALMWTVTMAVVCMVGMASASQVAESAHNDYERAGAGIGMAFGGVMLFMLWFAVTVSALVLGFFLKKTSVIEKGPTGPLVKN